MTKNNIYLPKENLAQVEEVREIENKESITPEEQAKLVDKLVKNEIPSYEEFMKTYQEDEGVSDNYYYEIDSYGDIRVVRCYGPGFWDEVGGFIIKTAATTVAAGAIVATAGAAAPAIGAGMWLGGKAAEEIGKDANCQFLRSVGSFTKDTGFGSLTGFASTAEGVANASVRLGWEVSKVEKFNKLVNIMGYVEAGKCVAEHDRHRSNGISYDRNCEICNL